MGDRCERCDKPIATDNDWEATPEGEGEGLCWGAASCCAVDWRARAMAAETERDTLRAIVEGRPTLPSEAEALALDEAHGQWLVASLSGHGSTVIDVCGLSVVALDSSRVLRVYALDAERRPCAWPVVAQHAEASR